MDELTEKLLSVWDRVTAEAEKDREPEPAAARDEPALIGKTHAVRFLPLF